MPGKSERVEKEGLPRGNEEVSAMINIFITLVVVMASQVYTYVKINKLVQFKYTLFCISYISIKSY